MFTHVLQCVVVRQCWNITTICSDSHYITSNMSIVTGCCDNAKASYHSDDTSLMFMYVLLFVVVGRCRNVKIHFVRQSFQYQQHVSIYGLLGVRTRFISTRFCMCTHVLQFVIIPATRFLCSKT